MTCGQSRHVDGTNHITARTKHSGISCDMYFLFNFHFYFKSLAEDLTAPLLMQFGGCCWSDSRGSTAWMLRYRFCSETFEEQPAENKLELVRVNVNDCLFSNKDKYILMISLNFTNNVKQEGYYHCIGIHRILSTFNSM